MSSEATNLHFISHHPDSKDFSASCKTCHRLAEIEGETVCFRQGKVTKLKKMEPSFSGLNLLCEGWKGKNR